MSSESHQPIKLSVHESSDPSDIVLNEQETDRDLDDLRASGDNEEDIDNVPSFDPDSEFDSNQINFANRTGG